MRRLRTHSIDPQKWPLPLLRWLAVLGLAIAWSASGAKTSPPHSWVPYAVIAGALILPDIAGFAIGGFRLDLKEAQEGIARLQQDVNNQARASAASIVAFGNDAFYLIERLRPGVTQAARDQATGPAAPWRPPGRAPQAEQIDSQPG